MGNGDQGGGSGGPCDACRIMAAALLGGIVGAVVALLLAPKPGRELRDDLRRGATTLGEKASATSGALAEKAQAGVGRAKELASEVRGRVAPRDEAPGEAPAEAPAEA